MEAQEKIRTYSASALFLKEQQDLDFIVNKDNSKPILSAEQILSKYQGMAPKSQKAMMQGNEFRQHLHLGFHLNMTLEAGEEKLF